MQRGVKLYDPVLNTFVIGENVECKLTIVLGIEECPNNFAAYAKHTAALQHYQNRANDGSKAKMLTDRVTKARMMLDKEILKQGDVNAFDSVVSRKFHSRYNKPF